jgi:hypothetical protein
MELVDKKKKSTVNKVKNSQETNNKNKKWEHYKKNITQ